MKKSQIIVQAEWDPDAKVWVATSEDVPGLVTEAATAEELDRKLQVMIPDLLESNEALRNTFAAEVPLIVQSELGRIRVHA